ncbi:MAG: hypothetical protein ACOCQD_00175 [archaeon]
MSEKIKRGRKVVYEADINELIKNLNLKMKYITDIVPRGHVVDIVGICENSDGKEYGVSKTIDIQRFYEAIGIEEDIDADRDNITMTKLNKYNDESDEVELFYKNGVVYSMN